MTGEARDLSIAIDRDATTVFDGFTDPRNLPAWARASNVRSSDDGWWILDTPRGEARIRFHADRRCWVVDHEYGDVTRTWRVPARITPDGDRCTLTLTLFRPAGMDDAAFARQIAAVRSELASLRDWLEAK